MGKNLKADIEYPFKHDEVITCLQKVLIPLDLFRSVTAKIQKG
jgi:hypothetical protein